MTIRSHFDPMKRCFKCGIDKERSEFYAHPAMGDGLLGKCKECTKLDARAVRKSKLEHYREYDVRRLQDNKERRAKMYLRSPVYRQRNPEKYHAHSLVASALRCGRLIKLPCQRCGTTVNVHGHHEDYSKPLDVMWLCAVHHAQRHLEIEAEKKESLEWPSNSKSNTPAPASI